MHIVYSNSYFFPVVREVNYDENEYRKIIGETPAASTDSSENDRGKSLQEIDNEFVEESTLK